MIRWAWVGLLAGCVAGRGEVSIDTSPWPIGDAECAVCGMVVGEQPSPRGQVVHRDGTHRHACSIGDLRAYVQAPNALGEPVAVYVEALPADLDISLVSRAPAPWVRAEEAFFVPAPDRPRIMGKPLLSFSDRETAEAAASRLGQPVLDWASLAETPFSELPATP